MKRQLLLACLLLLILPSNPATAQVHQWTPESPGWTPELREVWTAIDRCVKSIVDDPGLRKACVHPDFRGYGTESVVPVGLIDAEFDHWLETNTWHWMELTPLHIVVHGDLAVAQYLMNAGVTPEGDEMRIVWEAWTDVMVRDDGGWRWIADHGHEANR